MAAFLALVVVVDVRAVLLLVASVAVAVILIAASALAVVSPVAPAAAIPGAERRAPRKRAGTPPPPATSRYSPRTVPRADGRPRLRIAAVVVVVLVLS
jgi:hypothetical protein